MKYENSKHISVGGGGEKRGGERAGEKERGREKKEREGGERVTEISLERERDEIVR